MLSINIILINAWNLMIVTLVFSVLCSIDEIVDFNAKKSE